MAKVVVGLSGGVDSSVAAHLLKAQGHEVVGMFMRNWHDESVILDDECPWVDDSADAMLVAQKLDIPFHVIDLSEAYKQRIVDYMFAEYERGRTPNPDVLCNREIKFDVFLKQALALGANFVATGHYCQKGEVIVNEERLFNLLPGADQSKDQSYFLCQLNQFQLSKALFPIGHLLKSEVRNIAKKEQLVTADKKDSQGLCFVGKISLPDFLQQQLKPLQGDIIQLPALPLANKTELSLEECTQSPKVDLFSGNAIGKHNGAHFFTVGQRKGLHTGGHQQPLFVHAIDTHTNQVFVAEGDDNPTLFRHGLQILNRDVHWLRSDLKLKPGSTLAVWLRIRYRQPLFKATLHQAADRLHIVFDEPQKGVAPGQFAVWHLDSAVVGSGVIL